ncbi:MAG TPA: nicotinate (nicotinamide) nucleotide adenylyltransferase [Methylomirabilota bacterium]|nr:nicotinate (nicotinamide) nucleotide adenylyltransferase [Methylomirabilota bacterium]
MKIGLYGGSFDPVHLGHLLVARAALEEAHLHRLHFIPAAQSPFKPGRQVAPAEVRLRMLRLALAGETRCVVDEQEILRGGISYTIDTVRAYRTQWPQAEFYYLIGADHVPLLPKWRQSEELAAQLKFLVIPRPGETMAEFPAPFHGVYLKGVPIGLSSSMVRERVHNGQAIDHLTPKAVAAVIRDKRLYL